MGQQCGATSNINKLQKGQKKKETRRERRTRKGRRAKRVWHRGWGSVNKASTHTHTHIVRHTLTQRQHTKWACQAVQPVRQTQLSLRPKLPSAGATPPPNVFQQRPASSPLPLLLPVFPPPSHPPPMAVALDFAQPFHEYFGLHKAQSTNKSQICL